MAEIFISGFGQKDYDITFKSRNRRGGGGLEMVGPNSIGAVRTRATRSILHETNTAIYLMHDGRIHIGKNRHGKVGDCTLDEFMDIALKYFSKQVHNDVAEIFQQGLVDQIRKAIFNVLEENLLTKEIKDDTFRRTSRTDGV